MAKNKLLLAGALLLGCGGAQMAPVSEDLPCDEVQLLTESPRPDNLRRELNRYREHWQNTPSRPTEHLAIRAEHSRAEEIARGYDASLMGRPNESEASWHVLVFPSAQTAMEAFPQVVCEPGVVEIELQLEGGFRR